MGAIRLFCHISYKFFKHLKANYFQTLKFNNPMSHKKPRDFPPTRVYTAAHCCVSSKVMSTIGLFDHVYILTISSTHV